MALVLFMALVMFLALALFVALMWFMALTVFLSRLYVAVGVISVRRGASTRPTVFCFVRFLINEVDFIDGVLQYLETFGKLIVIWIPPRRWHWWSIFCRLGGGTWDIYIELHTSSWIK
jgi:hypothetical protein